MQDVRLHFIVYKVKGMKLFVSVYRILVVAVLICVYSHSNAQQNSPKPNRNSFAIDVIPFYYDFFDYRDQIRIGIDYTRQFKPHWVLSTALDIGLFDKYTYIKYYDFFSQGSGFYSVTQNAAVSGFHLQPSCNYYFCQSKKKLGQGFYGGGVLDLNYYRKKLESLNSQTLESSSEIKNQFRTAVGIDVGIRYYMGHHFFAELKSTFFCKLFLLASDNNINSVALLNAQWSSVNKNFWLLTNLQFGYAF